jgi:hypothetical protein
MVVSLVYSEQVVKPHSRQAVVKPEVLYLSECLVLVQYRLLKAIKMGVVFLKWAWLQKFYSYNPTIPKFLDPPLHSLMDLN